VCGSARASSTRTPAPANGARSHTFATARERDDWLRDQRLDGSPVERSPGTIDWHRRKADKWIKPHLGFVKLEDLRPLHVQQLNA
jgi:hypothetical protein